MLKWVVIGGLSALGAPLLVQLVPYRVTNPARRREPVWDSPRTRELAVAACHDCHSNETHTARWEGIAPLSWWTTDHVKEGREALNSSEWGSGGNGEGDDAAERTELAAGPRRTLGGGG